MLLLKAQDSTLVNGTSSGDFGEFEFENIPSGSYIIKTSFIGYNTNYTSLNVEAETKVEDIILIESAEQLSEVELVYQKPTLKREVDRLVFNVESTALSEGNMLEILRSTPSVIIMDDVIRVKNSSPTVYINDRKVHLSSSDLIQLLQGTSASTIKSVEVITNPSAKYDAESGIVLNIVMTKKLATGYNGSIFSNFIQGVFPKLNYGTSHYFKGKKLNLFANYSYTDQKIDIENKEIVQYSQEKWITDLDRNTWSENHNIALNLDYNLTDKSVLAIATNFQFLPAFRRITNGKTDISPTVNMVSRFTSENLSHDKKGNKSFDLDFVNQTGESSSLKLNAHYTDYDYRRNQNVSSRYFDLSNQFLNNTQFRTRADQGTSIFTSQLDYSISLGERSTLEAGIKYSDISTNSGLGHWDIVNGFETLNLFNTNDFQYDEVVSAGYLDFRRSGEKLTFNAGIRLEHTDLKGVSSNGRTNTSDYYEWFPTVNLGYQISEKVNSYVNYKRSVTRPKYNQLNPFLSYLNDNTIVAGNPNLNPSFLNRIAIGTSFDDKYIFEVYYNTHKDNSEQLPFQDNSTNIVTWTFLNIDETKDFGFDVELNFDLNDNWHLYLGSSTYKYKDQGLIFGIEESKSQWSNYSILNSDLAFLQDRSLSVMLSMTYTSKTVQGYQLVEDALFSNLSIRKKIFEDKGVLSLTLTDLFNTQDFLIRSDFANQNSSSFSNLDTRSIRVGFRYNFGNTKLETNEKELTKEELDRLVPEN